MIWVMPECNMAGMAGHTSVAVSDMHGVGVMHEDSVKDQYGVPHPGFRTTAVSKRTMVIKMKDAMNKGQIRLYEQFVCAGLKPNEQHKDILENFFSQFRFFSRIIVPPKDPTINTPTEKFSGKFRGMKDDMMMAAMICLRTIEIYTKHIEMFRVYNPENYRTQQQQQQQHRQHV